MDLERRMLQTKIEFANFTLKLLLFMLLCHAGHYFAIFNLGYLQSSTVCTVCKNEQMMDGDERL